MTREPVFNIASLNPGLFRKVERLKQVASLRLQLSKLARYRHDNVTKVKQSKHVSCQNATVTIYNFIL